MRALLATAVLPCIVALMLIGIALYLATRGALLPVALMAAGVAILLVEFIAGASAHDDGRFAGSPLKPWFDKLASGKGLCCSFADGVAVENVDWDVKDGHYRVRLDGRWIVVPDDAVVTEPNKFGPAVVWPVYGDDGNRSCVSRNPRNLPL